MREIKFRAFDKETGKMHYQVNRANVADELIVQFDCTGYTTKTEDRFLGSDCLMQYTGLKDKNGKEIYQGDIVKSEVFDIENGVKFSIEEVKWDVARGFYDTLFFERLEEHGRIECSEVIGNIFENPELLTKTEEGNE